MRTFIVRLLRRDAGDAGCSAEQLAYAQRESA
jgi:hypothetical protein